MRFHIFVKNCRCVLFLETVTVSWRSGFVKKKKLGRFVLRSVFAYTLLILVVESVIVRTKANLRTARRNFA